MSESKTQTLQNVPKEFICPLTKELMTDPVVSRYGHSFERKAILEWLNEGNNYCPVTGNPLRPSCLVSNKSLEWKIRCWFHDHGQEAPEHEDPIFSACSGFVSLLPENFKCALTKKPMEDPVISNWGHTFERDAIWNYLGENLDKCPMTGKPLHPHNLVPNTALKHEIHEWLEKNGDHGAELPSLGPIDDITPTPEVFLKAALVGIRGDHAVEEMRERHAEHLRSEGLQVDEEEQDILDPFCATSMIDEHHDTPTSLAHVY
jgi:hypothetical protein